MKWPLIYLPSSAAYNILHEKQINDIGANIGLFIALMVLGVGYSYLGLKFNGYLNKFMGKTETH